MDNKLIAKLIKLISSTIGWLGGGVAGITVILSSIGFLVLRSHHDLLGITEIAPRPPEIWPVEGARFVYNSLFFLVGNLLRHGWIVLIAGFGGILFLFWASEKWSVGIAAFLTKFPFMKVIIIVASFVAVLLIIDAFLEYEGVSDLLVVPQPFDDELVRRSQQEGIEELRVYYGSLELRLVLFLLWLIFLSCVLYHPKNGTTANAQKKNSIPFLRFSFWHLILWVLFLIPLLLLPINYGKLVKSNKFYRVHLFVKNELKDSSGQSQPPDEEGWLLYDDSSVLVLYQGSSAEAPIQILERKNFARIHIVRLENIFTGR